MNNVVIENILVRGGVQPPTFPIHRAAPALHGPSASALMKNITPMKKLGRILSIALPALALAAAGCKTPVAVQGQYSTPKETISGSLDATTNAVTVGGNYQTGGTNIGGTVTVGK
jgi:hypothetical protein